MIRQRFMPRNEAFGGQSLEDGPEILQPGADRFRVRFQPPGIEGIGGVEQANVGIDNCPGLRADEPNTDPMHGQCPGVVQGIDHLRGESPQRKDVGILAEFPSKADDQGELSADE